MEGMKRKRSHLEKENNCPLRQSSDGLEEAGPPVKERKALGREKLRRLLVAEDGGSLGFCMEWTRHPRTPGRQMQYDLCRSTARGV